MKSFQNSLFFFKEIRNFLFKLEMDKVDRLKKRKIANPVARRTWYTTSFKVYSFNKLYRLEIIKYFSSFIQAWIQKSN